MGMSTGSGDGKLVSEINVTPMVDVMLVLLIIFMLVGWMLGQDIKVNVPKAKNAELDLKIDKESSVVIALTDDGKTYVNKDPVPLADIPARVGALMKNKPLQEQIVYVKSDSKVKYETVISVVDAVRNAGYD
ncbi:MAG: ExbD/TolR family protein, partial [Blastocatellia bacterium]